MNNTKFTLFDLLYEIVEDWVKDEKEDKSSIIGNLLRHIEKKNKLRDAQYNAIKIFLWLKEVGNNRKLSTLIKEGIVFSNEHLVFYPGDDDYLDKPAKRFFNRYLQDAGVKNLDDYLRANNTYEEYEELIDNMFEDFDYPNYLFSLPMGAGKTFLMSAFIYIELYLLKKTNNNDKYSSNFIVIAPSARKTAILPALRTMKLFDPSWIIPYNEARELKRTVKIEILDEIEKKDKLQNQNPNLAKINLTINGHQKGNVFILNAEKVIPDNSLTEEEFNNLPLSQQTRILRAEAIKDALAKLTNIEIFLDEAHHSYSSDTETKKLRKQLDVINKNNNIKCCVGMSGTPYISRKLEFNNKKLNLQDIQDIVYYYPLTNAIGNFLKNPKIKMVDSNETNLITTSLTDFFDNYDIQYSNGSLSKIAFYCPSIDKLNEQILPVILKWYEDNGRDKNEILMYYSSNSKYPLPKENYVHFLNLDNPTSQFRVILLVAVGTEGWDCRSLTSVVLPRQHNEKNFVLQTTCRCLREVVNAINENALIYLDVSNFQILDDELQTNYHLRISDLNNKNINYKPYPVYKVKDDIGNVSYNNVFIRYIERVSKKENVDYRVLLDKYNFNEFKEKYPFRNEIGTTTISENGLTEELSFSRNSNVNINYSFLDFIYELEQSTFGRINCASFMKYSNHLNKIYNEIVKEDNYSWIVNHPSISTYDVCKDITSLFADVVDCEKEEVTEEVSIKLLDWDMSQKPVINVYEEEKNMVFPENAYDDIESAEYYEENLNEIIRRYNDKMHYPNKEKSFNYLPYKMDSMYEFDFLKNVLRNLDNKNIEIYYNGYKNNMLESLRIITPYGKYTPDFIVLKRDENSNIIKILLVETKGTPFETEAKEKFIKEQFIKSNPNYSYIRIGDTENNDVEYMKLISLITEF